MKKHYSKKRKYLNPLKPKVESFITRVRDIGNTDPKPIFDHVRNIGIAAAIIYGATFIQSTYYKADLHNNDQTLTTLCIWFLTLTGMFLIAININHAQRSIATLLYGESQANEVMGNIYISLWKWLKKLSDRKGITVSPLFSIARYLMFQIIIGIYLILVLLIGYIPMIEKHRGIEKNRADISTIIRNTDMLDAKVDRLARRLDIKKESKIPTKREDR